MAGYYTTIFDKGPPCGPCGANTMANSINPQAGGNALAVPVPYYYNPAQTQNSGSMFGNVNSTGYGTQQNFAAKKPCCGSCGSNSGACTGGTCTVNVGGIGAGCDMPGSSPGDSIARGIDLVPPGYFNCEPDSGVLAPCDVDKIIRTRRRFTAVGDTAAATMTVDTIVESQLDTPAGFDWFAVTVDPVEVSHQLCPREFSVLFDDGAAIVAVAPTDVAVQSEGLYQDGDGSWVKAWSWPKPADPDDLKITDARCACERLCDCSRARGHFRLLMLLPSLGVGESYTATIKGVRDCWRLSCGSCPPDNLCGRQLTGL